MGSRLMRHWEALPGTAQALLSFAVFSALMFAMHITVLDQPLGRAVGYGVFWGFVFMLLALWATRSEQARRAGARPGDE